MSAITGSIADVEQALLNEIQIHNFQWQGTSDWESEMRCEQRMISAVHYLVGLHDTHIGELMNKCIELRPENEAGIRNIFAYWLRPL